MDPPKIGSDPDLARPGPIQNPSDPLWVYFWSVLGPKRSILTFFGHSGDLFRGPFPNSRCRS